MDIIFVEHETYKELFTIGNLPIIPEEGQLVKVPNNETLYIVVGVAHIYDTVQTSHLTVIGKPTEVSLTIRIVLQAVESGDN